MIGSQLTVSYFSLGSVVWVCAGEGAGDNFYLVWTSGIFNQLYNGDPTQSQSSSGGCLLADTRTLQVCGTEHQVLFNKVILKNIKYQDCILPSCPPCILDCSIRRHFPSYTFTQLARAVFSVCCASGRDNKPLGVTDKFFGLRTLRLE